jgi:hypothetical protein
LILQLVGIFSINRSEVINLGDLPKYDLQGLLGSTETYFRVILGIVLEILEAQ